MTHLVQFSLVYFFNWNLWWETKAIWKKLSILLDDKFHEFSLGKIKIKTIMQCGALQYQLYQKFLKKFIFSGQFKIFQMAPDVMQTRNRWAKH